MVRQLAADPRYLRIIEFQKMNEVSRAPPKKKFFLTNHFKAILFKRWVLLKRSLKTMILSIVLTLVFSVLSIVANYLMKFLLKDKVEPINFTSFLNIAPDIAIVKPTDGDWHEEYMEIVKNMYKQDTGKDVEFLNFTSREELNEWMYQRSIDRKGPAFIQMGIGFNKKPGMLTPYNLSGYYNGSWVRNEELATRVQLTRMMWKKEFGASNDFVFSSTRLMRKIMDFMFGQLAPMLITCGLISVIPIVISQPILDIRGEVRQYMESCSLTLLPYWAATYLIDLIIWVIEVNIIWAIFMAAQVTAMLDNMFNTWYCFMLSGPSLILFCYCFSFLFQTPESGTRSMFIIFILVLIIPIIIDMIRKVTAPLWLEWIYSFIPFICTQRIFLQMLSHVNILKQPFKYFWVTDYNCRVFLIMQYGDIVIYAFVLYLIEHFRIKAASKHARTSFGNYTEFFSDAKKKHPVTEEARKMEEEVHESFDYAVRIIDVSRLFFNTAGDPIPAVNNVSLGVKENSIFGFLGANGAGKTTLIKMITSMLPPSAGTIEINGIDISKDYDPRLLSICPQFNTHLCEELTPLEHFKLYRMIHQLDIEESEAYAKEMIEKLELEPHKDKPVRELSGGNQRKVSIALSFYAPASIILLDEPTSSLDPVARHHVHEMIMNHRGHKTFMLCTHLLSEAETLCDQISIMIKGCVYTCGTPQYLSEKFGTEYKIDVMLEKNMNDMDIYSNGAEKCTAFFAQNLPFAELSITRPNVRIYSVPADEITLANLFQIMEQGIDGENGFTYYTCSTSSLERVFMEIVHLSENEDAVFAKP